MISRDVDIINVVNNIIFIVPMFLDFRDWFPLGEEIFENYKKRRKLIETHFHVPICVGRSKKCESNKDCIFLKYHEYQPLKKTIPFFNDYLLFVKNRCFSNNYFSIIAYTVYNEDRKIEFLSFLISSGPPIYLYLKDTEIFDYYSFYIIGRIDTFFIDYFNDFSVYSIFLDDNKMNMEHRKKMSKRFFNQIIKE